MAEYTDHAMMSLIIIKAISKLKIHVSEEDLWSSKYCYYIYLPCCAFEHIDMLQRIKLNQVLFSDRSKNAERDVIANQKLENRKTCLMLLHMIKLSTKPLDNPLIILDWSFQVWFRLHLPSFLNRVVMVTFQNSFFSLKKRNYLKNTKLHYP